MNVTELASAEALEAAASHFAQTAWLAERLYAALIDVNLPPDLVADMVRDWHNQAIADEQPFDDG